MKPALTMDGKSAGDVRFVVQQPETVKATSKRTLVIVISVIALVSLLVIVGVTLGAFYLGLNTGKDSYKEAWVTFNTGEGNKTVIKERLIVRETDVKIIRPGLMTMVIDYEKGMLVVQSDRELQGDETPDCYVYDYEPGMFGSAQEEKNKITGGQTNVTVPLKSDELRFKSTGETVPMSELSATARQMCFGANVFRVHRVEPEDMARVRRNPGVYIQICIIFVCVTIRI